VLPSVETVVVLDVGSEEAMVQQESEVDSVVQ